MATWVLKLLSDCILRIDGFGLILFCCFLNEKMKAEVCFLLTEREYMYQRFRILYRLLCLDWENGMEKKGRFASWVLKFLANCDVGY